MENRVVWAPRVALGVVAWAAGAVFAAVTVVLLLGGDTAGPLLFAVATLGAVAFGCYTSFGRPRLVADPTGLRVRTLGSAYGFAWGDVRTKVVTTPRLGREVRTLEIDTGDRPPHLIVLGRLELDADPADVLETLDALRPPL